MGEGAEKIFEISFNLYFLKCNATLYLNNFQSINSFRNPLSNIILKEGLMIFLSLES